MLGINNVLTVNPVRGCAIPSGSIGFIVKRCYKHATPSASGGQINCPWKF